MSTDKPKHATAVGYDADGSGVPEVLASGQGYQAERILAMAEEAGIPVREDPMLAQALAQLSQGQDIPPDLYLAIAEALIWAWKADQSASSSG